MHAHPSPYTIEQLRGRHSSIGRFRLSATAVVSAVKFPHLEGYTGLAAVVQGLRRYCCIAKCLRAVVSSKNSSDSQVVVKTLARARFQRDVIVELFVSCRKEHRGTLVARKASEVGLHAAFRSTRSITAGRAGTEVITVTVSKVTLALLPHIRTHRHID